MTSLARELGTAPDAARVERVLAAAFGEVFRLKPVEAVLSPRKADAPGSSLGMPNRSTPRDEGNFGPLANHYRERIENLVVVPAPLST
jgi:hypothetical protein